MSDFPLLNLPQVLLENVLTKTNSNSNFRLRRTCYYLRDLIQSSKNATVCWNGIFCIGLFGIHRYVSICRYQVRIDMEGFYGARLEQLHIANHVDPHQFQEIYDYLRKYRITCNKASLSVLFTTDQYASLLELLKPVDIKIECLGISGMHRVLLCSKTLSRVNVCVTHDDAVDAMEKLLSRYKEIEVAISVTRVNRPDVFAMLRQSLEVLLSSEQSATKFILKLYGPSSSLEQLAEAFPTINWIYQLEEKDPFSVDKYCAKVALPSHFPQYSTCKLTVDYLQGAMYTKYQLYYEICSE